MLKRFAIGSLAATLLAACTTPLEPSPPASPPTSSKAAPSSSDDAAHTSATAFHPLDLGWPGTSPADADGVPEDGSAHLRADVGTFFEEGMASWYGKAFNKRRTASGERFNMHAMTAAHPTLPLLSWVLVRNVRNNKAVMVRITDRGPYSKHRIIDLSYAAAKKLGFAKRGVAKVEIRKLTHSEVIALRMDQEASLDGSSDK
ncbi:hypothetical protein PATSB16_41840 [Pandoraea thiooxydans]|uniref:Endolytic peptidoglycan transglycosylase RlpA n=1 Tax=Pandoraea thiooxydans TaxID=445709 RepID=A0A0G3EUF4_9BURK|nr:septal ring lytic transglycosylase RlpA family protein [Pandoraea thiooxydans]AKJ70688.2 hypothetical protein ABW99_17705 [Pandoraea thiooxydans]APR97518.1 hypothetical protein PATSB16_41840 [Pandoraea thiooxydans]